MADGALFSLETDLALNETLLIDVRLSQQLHDFSV